MEKKVLQMIFLASFAVIVLSLFYGALTGGFERDNGLGKAFKTYLPEEKTLPVIDEQNNPVPEEPLQTESITRTTRNTKTSYFYANGKIAQLDGQEIKYVLTDNLKSTSKTLDKEGNVLDSVEYYAFGQEKIPSTEEFKYTGKQQDDETGLYYYGARYYEPVIGRFLTTDTQKGKIKNPQSLNRYAYVLNNPSRYIDPTGKDEIEAQMVNSLGQIVERQKGTDMVSFDLAGKASGHYFFRVDNINTGQTIIDHISVVDGEVQGTKARINSMGSPIVKYSLSDFGITDLEGEGMGLERKRPDYDLDTNGRLIDGTASVGLLWTAPGDDDNTGTASSYTIKYSVNPPSTYSTIGEWFANAIEVKNPPIPKSAGQIESFTVEGLLPNTYYYFAIVTADEVNNYSPVSNVAVANSGEPDTPEDPHDPGLP